MGDQTVFSDCSTFNKEDRYAKITAPSSLK